VEGDFGFDVRGELGEVLVADDAPELLLGFEQRLPTFRV
jgi:hypothetical protein